MLFMTCLKWITSWKLLQAEAAQLGAHDDPERWDVQDREGLEGGDTCAHMAGSCCTAENNTALSSNFSPIKNKKIKGTFGT